jgi:putative DNA primase/helicase
MTRKPVVSNSKSTSFVGNNYFAFLNGIKKSDPELLRSAVTNRLESGDVAGKYKCPSCGGTNLTFSKDGPAASCWNKCREFGDAIEVAKHMGEGVAKEIAIELGFQDATPKKAKKTGGTFDSFDAARTWFESVNQSVVVYKYGDSNYVLRGNTGRIKASGKEDKVAHPLTRHPDGKWRFKEAGHPWPLFMTREPVAGHDTIVICEGEKAASAIAKCNSTFVGVTSRGGSGRAASWDWSTLPAGEVLLFPDNDGDGTKYAHAVAGLIGRPCRILDVTSLPPTGDAADLLEGLDGLKADDKLREFIAANAKPYEAPVDAPQESEELATARDTELSNVDRFLKRHGRDVRYVKDAAEFLAWDGKRWARDPKKTVVRSLMSGLSRWIDKEASEETVKETREMLREWASKCESNKVIRQSVDLVPVRRSVWAKVDDFDQKHELLNTPNGTVDLRTGELLPHRREDLITRITLAEYDPSATHPLWDQTLELFIPDPAVREYIQRIVGCSLTGRSEKIFPILWGGGNNGKGSIFETLGKSVIGGDYCASVSPDAITDSGNKAAIERTNVKFVGKRLILFEETQEGDTLTTAIKRLASGGDTLEGRHNFGEAFNFAPTHSLLLMTNHEPRLNTFDLAMRTRIKFINFGVTVKPNGEIRRQLETSEALHRAALAWAVRGAIAYIERGLSDEPEAVVAATELYFAKQDLLGRFLEECFSVADPTNHSYAESKANVYRRYLQWAEEQGLRKPLSKIALGRKLEDRGYVNTGNRDAAEYDGLRLILF